MSAREVSWKVSGLTLRGLEWGEAGGSPVLALHGWQDNAASFTQLAERLPACHIVAPDLTGHGLSDFRSEDATYNVWDDLPQLNELLECLGWKQCAFLGHSRGAIIATLFAAAVPERCRTLVMLDGIIPDPLEDQQVATQLGRFVRERGQSLNRVPRRYAEHGAAVEARMRAELSREAAETLASRGLLGNAQEGWYWRLDPRLRGASAAKLSSAQIDVVLASVQAPALLLLANDGPFKGWDVAGLAQAKMKALEVIRVDGDHHFHMVEGFQPWDSHLLDYLCGDEQGAVSNA